MSEAKRRTWWNWRTGLFLVAALAAAVVFGWGPLHDYAGSLTVATGPNGPETPASVGLAFERLAIPSGERRLDAYLVRAEVTCADAPAVLIFHGLGETISRWVKAQRFLHDRCVSSLVFDYSGSGDSSRPGGFDILNEDVPAAYAFARRQFLPQTRLYVLGHSMGNAPMLLAAPKFSPAPDGIIVANAFSTLRASMERSGYGFLAFMMPDFWNNVRAIGAVHIPVLVVHSDADIVNPAEDGRAVFAAAHEPKTLSIVHGFRHNALHRDPSEAWWAAVLQFMHAPKVAS